MKPNSYELAQRAMRLQASVACGPNGQSCDLGYMCPAHGGDRQDSDSWTPDDQRAFDEWMQRWSTEVMKDAR